MVSGGACQPSHPRRQGYLPQEHTLQMLSNFGLGEWHEVLCAILLMQCGTSRRRRQLSDGHARGNFTAGNQEHPFPVLVTWDVELPSLESAR